MTTFPLCRSVAAVVSLMLIPAAAVNAQDADDFGWSITPYLWATETGVDLALRDADIGAGEISFSDLLDVLDPAFMIHVEGGKGNWTAFGDLTYLKTSDTVERTAFVIDTDSKRQQNRILFGYQYKTAEFKDVDLRLDYDYRGPMAGFNFRF